MKQTAKLEAVSEDEGINNGFIREQVKSYLDNYVEIRERLRLRYDVELSDYVNVERVDVVSESISGRSATIICKLRFEPKRNLSSQTPAARILEDVLGQQGIRYGQTIFNELKFTFTKTESGWIFDERHEIIE